MANKERILLIVGCSHAAGYEINGGEDSPENREMSFGNKLAGMLGRTPVNIALGGFSNGAIFRSLLEWLNKKYDPETQDLSVLVAWTEPFRMDIPSNVLAAVYDDGKFPAERFVANTFFTQMVGVFGAETQDPNLMPYREILLSDKCHPYLDVMSLTQMIAAQQLLANLGIGYLMCNTMNHPAVTPITATYLSALNKDLFVDILEPSKCFYFYYRDQGYDNPKAQYWHHSEEPHQLYAEYLHQYITDNDVAI